MADQLALLQPKNKNGRPFPAAEVICCGPDAVYFGPKDDGWWCRCCGASFGWDGVSRKPHWLMRDSGTYYEGHHGYFQEGARFNWAGCSLAPPHSNKKLFNKPVPVEGCDCARCTALREQAGGDCG